MVGMAWLVVYLLVVLMAGPSLSEWTLQCSSCDCKWIGGKKQANCTDRSLSTVPDTMHRDIQVLILDNNTITRLGDSVFHARLPNLQKIFLRHCGLKTVAATAFKDLKILIEVDLSYNNITQLDRRTFAENGRLKILNLSHNPIRTLEPFQFPALPHLKTIDLSYCHLETIQVTAFGNLGNSLEAVRLLGNRLTSLQEEMFQSLSNLKSLELHKNPWRCDCHLKTFREWVVEKGLYNYPTTCREPERLSDKMWDTIPSQEFACKPRIEVSQGRIYSQPGTNVTLSCFIKGNPVPEAKWVLRGRIVNNNTSPTGVGNQIYLIHELGGLERWFNLTVINLQEEDADDYTCVAVNAGGVSEQNVSLTFDTPALEPNREEPPEKERHFSTLITAITGGCVLSLASILFVSYVCCRTRLKQQAGGGYSPSLEQGFTNPDHQHLIEPRGILKQSSRQQQQSLESMGCSGGDTCSLQDRRLFGGSSGSNHTMLSQASVTTGDADMFPDILNIPNRSIAEQHFSMPKDHQPLDPTSLLNPAYSSCATCNNLCATSGCSSSSTVPTAAILPPPTSFLGPPPHQQQVQTVPLNSCRYPQQGGILLNYVTLPRHPARRTLLTFDGSEARESLIQSRDSAKVGGGAGGGESMGELSEIPPVPPPAQFDTRGCCTSDLCNPTLRLNENIWVKNSCQTLPNTKLRPPQQQRGGGGGEANRK